MKKLLVALTMVALLLQPAAVYAAAASFSGGTGGVDCSGATDSPVCQDLQSTGNPLFGPDGVITKVGVVFGILTGIISVFMIVIGGLRYATSAGDSSKTATAKNTIMYAAIGLAVSVAASSIARFILSKVS